MLLYLCLVAAVILLASSIRETSLTFMLCCNVLQTCHFVDFANFSYSHPVDFLFIFTFHCIGSQRTFWPCFLIYIYPWMKMLLVAFKYLLHHCAQCLAIVQSLLINKVGIFKRTNSRDFVLVDFLIGRTPKVLQNMMQYQLHSPTSALPTARNTSFSHLPAWRSWNTICNTLARTLPVYLSLF